MALLRFLVVALIFALMIRACLSFFPSKGLVAKAQKVSRTLTEWSLRPVRRIVPPVGWKAFRLDLSPAIVLVVCQLVLLPVLT